MILHGDCLETLKTLEAGLVQTCVTSPPYYGLRDYGVSGQIGLEETPEAYVQKLVEVFREVKRVLKDDGTLWLNLGDSYATKPGSNNQNLSKWAAENARGGGHRAGDLETPTRHALSGMKQKDLIGIPWMVAFALRADGWYLRQDIIWAKPNPMPESVKDRCTKSHEYIFLLSKSQKYFYDYEAVLEPAVNRPTDSWEKRKAAGAGSGSVEDGHNSSLAKGKGFSHTLGGYSSKVIGQTQDGHSGYINADGTVRGKVVDGELMRNKRDVWTINTKPYKGAHFATFPPKLIEPCILAGSRKGDIVLDPFNGSGTTGQVALEHGRDYIGCELNSDYIKLTEERLDKVQVKL